MGKFTENDRERVLMRIVTATMASIHDTVVQVAPGVPVVFTFLHAKPQFLPDFVCDRIGMPIKPGDIVKCMTNPYHRWGISEFVKIQGNGAFLLKEIGGKKLCNMSNETFLSLRFMPPGDLLCGDKRKIYRWCQMAFDHRYNKDVHFWDSPYFGGVVFEKEGVTIVGAPSKNARHAQQVNYRPQPKRFFVRWENCNRLKDIVACLIHQGFNDPAEFSYKDPEYPGHHYSVEDLREIARKVNHAS